MDRAHHPQRQQPANMRSSKTMPQLNYTKADIQEQYLNRQVRHHEPDPADNNNKRPRHEQEPSNSKSATDSHNAHQAPVSSRLQQQHSGQSRLVKGDQFDGDDRNQRRSRPSDRQSNSARDERRTGDYDNENEPPNGSSHQQLPSKRKSRSQSASRLLSACFHIPAQLASSISSHQNFPSSCSSSSRPRTKASSILSHFRIGHHHQHHPGQSQMRASASSDDYPPPADDKCLQRAGSRGADEIGRSRRPLSNSRTDGNLQQLHANNNSDSLESSSGRMKHVSFGEHNDQRQQHQLSDPAGLKTNKPNNVITSQQAQDRQANAQQQQLTGKSRFFLPHELKGHACELAHVLILPLSFHYNR